MRTIWIMALLLGLVACQETDPLQQLGQAFQERQDYGSLKAVLDAMPAEPDTALIKQLLGEPIDMGFDYRYLIDSLGPDSCVIGAVFHLEEGRSDNRWIGQICE